MMKLRKLRLTLAVSAVLGATALIPATSFGWSVDTPLATLDNASGGDTLLFPLYTTVNPMTTSFSTTNTGGQTIVAKIRFREQERSMDVLDFLVIYSPYDKFDFYVTQAADAARPTMKWNDNTCVVGPGTESVEFPAPSPFVSGDETMSVGHLEVLGMADLTSVYVTADGGVFANPGDGRVSLAAAAEHGPDGVPLDCNLLTRWLSSPTNVQALNNVFNIGNTDAPGDVGNFLVGRYLVTGVGLGIEAGSDAVSIQDSNLGWPLNRITAQSGADCVNCDSYYAWDGLEWDHPHLGEMQFLNGFQSALTAPNVAGDWSNNPANFVGLDWILSFPNKYAYLDLVDGAQCAGGAGAGTSEWCLLYAPKTAFGFAGLWTSTGVEVRPGQTLPDGEVYGTSDLCLNDNQLRVWDTEEQEASGNVSVSPGTRTTLDICNELQVFTLAPAGTEPRPSVIQTAERRGVIAFENLDTIRGWGQMNLSWASAPFGDSVLGGIFTTRNTDDPTINNASLTDLQKAVGGFEFTNGVIQ